MGKADIYQVAKEAGVSISTVSRAFTRPELVSAKTRRKVLDGADKLDFNISLRHRPEVRTDLPCGDADE